LELAQISKSFGSTTALSETTLSVDPGSLMALLGPSGCGKTTTLRVIAGFENPDSGAVLLNGQDVTGIPPFRRGLGMVFQNYSLFPHMSIADNVGFGLKMAKVPSTEAARRIADILKLVHLHGMEERFPHQLSGGQQQRVALARALVTQPKVLLLDEPLGALDKNLRESMQFELRRLQQSLGITSILVTHDQEEALTVSDRIAVMNQGRILQVGSPTEIYARPRTRFVSEFLGTSNILRCRVADYLNNMARLDIIDVPDAAGPFLVNCGDARPSRSDVLVAIRPEQMRLVSGKPDGNQMSVPGRVLDRVFRGTYHAYQVRVPGRAEPLFVNHQAAGSEGGRIFEAEDNVYVVWRADSAVLLHDDR
jgi:putative spermidine/putrescine transport system ATP-binding protein